MKLCIIVNDSSWFWVLDETGRTWECWHEVDDLVAVRLPKLDRVTVGAVTEMMEFMAIEAQDELANA